MIFIRVRNCHRSVIRRVTTLQVAHHDDSASSTYLHIAAHLG